MGDALSGGSVRRCVSWALNVIGGLVRLVVGGVERCPILYEEKG